MLLINFLQKLLWEVYFIHSPFLQKILGRQHAKNQTMLDQIFEPMLFEQKDTRGVLSFHPKHIPVRIWTIRGNLQQPKYCNASPELDIDDKK
jgi:hypothetical protein